MQKRRWTLSDLSDALEGAAWVSLPQEVGVGTELTTREILRVGWTVFRVFIRAVWGVH